MFELESGSAEGAEYESQGQARSEAERVAPGRKESMKRALKVRNIIVSYCALSELQVPLFLLPRGDASRFARRLPLAVIFRAFGATRVKGINGPLQRYI
jgi:hypothetical protein